jgi:hypothetical protein
MRLQSLVGNSTGPRLCALQWWFFEGPGSVTLDAVPASQARPFAKPAVVHFSEQFMNYDAVAFWLLGCER